MTKVFQILEEEKQEAIKQVEITVAKNLIKEGVDDLMIMKGTGLTKEELEEIKNNMLITKQGIKSRLLFIARYLVAFSAHLIVKGE